MCYLPWKYNHLKIFIWSENFQHVRSWWYLMPTLGHKRFFIIWSTHWSKEFVLLSSSQRQENLRAIQIFYWTTKLLLILHRMWIPKQSYNGSLKVISWFKALSYIPIKGEFGLHQPLTHWFSLSSTDSDPSWVIIKMMGEELKITFSFGLSLTFCDISMGLICI